MLCTISKNREPPLPISQQFQPLLELEIRCFLKGLNGGEKQILRPPITLIAKNQLHLVLIIHKCEQNSPYSIHIDLQ